MRDGQKGHTLPNNQPNERIESNRIESRQRGTRRVTDEDEDDNGGDFATELANEDGNDE